MGDYEKHFNDCEAIPIKVNRVFDSCSDKDCIKGVRVLLSEPLSSRAAIVKTRCITVSNVCMNVEPIPFNKGFYSVDITFTFDVQFLVYETACGKPKAISGTASVSKNCVLFGSETSSKTFSSDDGITETTGECCNIINPPTALVQAVSPLVLEAEISNVYADHSSECTSKGIILTIGLFYVVELTRPVTIMVPAYNYNIPQKKCCSDFNTPCEIFNKIKFPTEEFSPVKLENTYCSCYSPSSEPETGDKIYIEDDDSCQDTE